MISNAYFFSLSKPNFLLVTLLKALFLSSRATVLYHSIWFRCFQIFLLPLLQPQKRVLCTELRVKKKRSHATFSHLGIILSDRAFYFQIYLINIFTASWSWNRQQHGQTIHSKGKFISMNLFKILCIVTWAGIFLTSMFMEAVRGQKRYRERTLWHFKSTFGSSHSDSSAYQKK